MATTAVTPGPSLSNVNLAKTENCVYITTHFRMGIGRMRQISNLKVDTTADQSQLRHQKKLIDSPELDEIRSQDGYMKRYIDRMSSYADDSTRFLPKDEEATKLYRAMEAYRTIRRPELVAAFMRQYRKLEDANFEPLREVLGEQFSRKDYPESDIVEAGFEFTYRLRPVGELNLTGLPDFIIALEIQKERETRAVAVIEWKKTMRVALAGLVEALFDALKKDGEGKRKKLYDTHVSNLTDFLNTFAKRDLADDAETQQQVKTLYGILHGVSVEKLRHSDNLKEFVASKLVEVKANVGALVQESGRKFR